MQFWEMIGRSLVKFHGSSPLAELGMAVIYMRGVQNLIVTQGSRCKVYVLTMEYFQWCDWKWITVESQFLEFLVSLTFR